MHSMIMSLLSTQYMLEPLVLWSSCSELKKQQKVLAGKWPPPFCSPSDLRRSFSPCSPRATAQSWVCEESVLHLSTYEFEYKDSRRPLPISETHSTRQK